MGGEAELYVSEHDSVLHRFPGTGGHCGGNPRHAPGHCGESGHQHPLLLLPIYVLPDGGFH